MEKDTTHVSVTENYSISAPNLEKSEPSEKLGGDEEKLTKSEITMPSLYPEHNISIPKYCEPEGNKDENKENESKIDKENILEADNNAETFKESEKCTETSVEKSSENLSKDIKCTEALKNIDLLKETEKNKEVLLEVEMSDIPGEDVEDITEVAKDSEMLVDDSKDVETDIKVIEDVNVPKKFDENSNDIMEVDEEKEVLLTILDNTEALVNTLNKLEVSTKMNTAEVNADVNKVEVLVDVNEAKAPIDVNKAETSAVMNKAETLVDVVLTNVKSAEISFNVNNTEVSTNAIDAEVSDSMKNAESPKNVMNNPEIPADVNKTEVSACVTNNAKLQDFMNCEEVPGSAYDNLDLPVEMKIDKEGAIAKLIINGFEGPDEDYKVMTLQEVGDFLKKETLRYMRDPCVNPLIQVQKKINSLVEQIEAKTAEMKELANSVQKINEDQVKFLRHMGAMPKIETKDASVHIDLEWLPEELENMCEKNAKRNIPKKSSKRNRPKTPPNVELIDLTDEVERAEPPELKNAKPVIETKHTTVELPKVKAEKINYITNLTTIPYAPGLLVTALPSPLLVSTSACILNNSDIPPKPLLKIYVDKNGILLQWDMPPEAKKMKITGYEIFVSQEKPDVIVNNSVWKKIGTVDAMPLPMSCTLTQFVEGFKYNFCIRAMANDKYGNFSDPSTVVFIVKK